MKPERQAAYDHTFRAIHDDEIPWQEGSKSVLKLPDGVQVKIFAHDKAMGRVNMKVKFPPGYVEPEHAHKSWHSIVVLKGRMCVGGKDLRPRRLRLRLGRIARALRVSRRLRGLCRVHGRQRRA
jgi:hypothetical protein